MTEKGVALNTKVFETDIKKCQGRTTEQARRLLEETGKYFVSRDGRVYLHELLEPVAYLTSQGVQLAEKYAKNR